MEFSTLRDLIHDVKIGVPVGDNQALQALRQSAEKFMTLGELYEHTFTITLDEDETEYTISMPDEVYIKEIIDQDADVTFDGLYTITFDSAYYATGDEYELKTYLGYNNNATDYPEWIVKRYHRGLVAGARDYLSPDRTENRKFHDELSSAMHFAGTFKGAKANDSV